MIGALIALVVIAAPIVMWPLFAALFYNTASLARRIIENDTSRGRRRLAQLGDDEQLIREGRISAHGRLARPDGAFIDYWVIRARANPEMLRGTVLLIHGLWDSKGTFLRLGEAFAQAGFDVVLPDLRAHGHSGGSYTTWGALEKADLKALMDHLLSERAVRPPCFAWGFSFGAATAIQYAAIDPRCRGVMAMAPFSDGRAICRRKLLPFAPLISRVRLEQVYALAEERAGFSFSQASTVTAARELKCPLLLVHGQLDLTVPTRHSLAVFQAAGGPKRRIVVPLCGHNSLLRGRRQWIVQQWANLAQSVNCPGTKPPAVLR